MKDLRLGASTWLWESPFRTASIARFKTIKELGFDVVEIPVEDPALIDPEEVEKALGDYGLEATVCGVFGPTKDLTHEDPKVHAFCFDYLRKCFEFSRAWGTDFVAGPMYSAVGKARMLPEAQRQLEWNRAVENVHQVCRIAEQFDCVVALEPLNRFESDMVNTAEDVMRLVNAIDHPRARVLLDSFHLTIEEKNLKEAVLTVGDRLIHVQVSENHRGIPGTGLTPWNDFKAGLDAVGYQGAVVIESFTPENKELAGAVCIWKQMADSQDEFAARGLKFLTDLFNA